LPFRAKCFAAVAALWMLYYLDEPALALAEASRVLRAEGNFVACTSSRYNDPEFASVLPDWENRSASTPRLRQKSSPNTSRSLR
jgi:ubiquinone/menaquinone biosynthesis C-methylase UbiE